MATKKFTIPSLSELEQSKHGEYKAKTLFDQHKTSPKKNEAKSSAVNGTNERPVKRPAEHSDSQMDKVAQKRVKTAEATASVSSRKLTTETTQVSRDSTSNTGNTSDSVNVDVKGNTSVTPVPGSPPRTSSATVAPPLAISPSRPSKSSNLVVSSRQVGSVATYEGYPHFSTCDCSTTSSIANISCSLKPIVKSRLHRQGKEFQAQSRKQFQIISRDLRTQEHHQGSSEAPFSHQYLAVACFSAEIRCSSSCATYRGSTVPTSSPTTSWARRRARCSCLCATTRSSRTTSTSGSSCWATATTFECCWCRCVRSVEEFIFMFEKLNDENEFRPGQIARVHSDLVVRDCAKIEQLGLLHTSSSEWDCDTVASRREFA